MIIQIRECVAFFIGGLQLLFDTLNSVDIGYGLLYVGLGDLLVVITLFAIILGVLWKGAKA